MKTPEFLSKGDLIYLTAPAKAIEKKIIDYSKELIEDLGFRVLLSENINGREGYFSGSDIQRSNDFQYGIDHPEVKAILCARGGYGCIRILPYLNWAQFIKKPKWICGFSDVTVLHHQVFNYGIKSLHSTMPLNFENISEEAILSLQQTLLGKKKEVRFSTSSFNKKGNCNGVLIGGNLSILYSLLATDLSYDFHGRILFIEDLGEQLYHLDRMLFTLERRGVFEQINGLVVGGITDMKDTEFPTGFEVINLFLEKLKYRKIPVCFNAPVGHIYDNRTLIIGNEVELNVVDNEVQLIYL